MDYRRTEIRAGIFLLLAFVILVIMVFAVSDVQSLFKKKKEVSVLFAFSDGIEKNAPVRYAGMKVGKVENVRVAPAQNDRIEVTLSVYSDTAIQKDTRAAIKTLGLVGGKYVELSGGTPGSSLLGPNESLVGEEPLKLEDVTKAALDVVAKLQNIATNLNRALGDPELARSLKTTVQNLQEASGNIKVMTASKDDVAQTLKNLPALVKKLDESATSLQALTKKTDALVGENKKNVDAMMQSLRDTAQNLKETTDDVKSHPWKLLRKP
ncbi:MAG TPA: MlaD family protein [Nitrospirota bacterium]|nr:MlaD family protein [Nitrospirota bacterium]